MVSTLMHILYGTMVALTLKLNLPLFLIFTNLPDLDAIVDVLNNKLKYHKYILHNIFVFFLMLVMGSFFFSFKLILIALTLHFVLDFFDGYNAFFFPFSKKKIGFDLLGGKKKEKKNPLWMFIFYEGNIFFLIISLIIFIIFLLFYFF